MSDVSDSVIGVNALRKIAGLAAVSVLLLLAVGCGGSTTVVTTPPPPPPPPPPVVEVNSCKTTNTTSPAQPAPATNVAGPVFHGVVKAGQSPIAGASVMLWAAGSKGNGSGAAALLASSVMTDANGSFAVPAGFVCAYSNTVLYVVASGGNNLGTQLVAMLGECGSLASGATVTVNEATTVAAAYAMAQFFNGDASTLAASATNSNGIALAASTAVNLVDETAGTVPGAGFPATGVAPVAKINTLANLLHGCVVSSSGSSTACTELFAAAYGAAGKAANEAAGETFGAVLSIARNPGTNVAALFQLSQGSVAYEPALSAAPADWTLTVKYGGAGMKGPGAVSIDSTGSVWVVNYYSVASLFTNTGTPVFSTGITGDNLLNSFGGAVDVNDSFWMANEESNGFNDGLGSVSVLTKGGGSTANYSAGGIDFPIAVAFDTSGVSWVVDYGDSSMTLLDGSGSPLSGPSGYSAKNLIFPVAVATDAKCNAYVANQSSNTITRVIADGSANTDYTVGEGPSGVAVDAGGNVWSANFYGDSVGLVSAAGSVVSGSGYTGGGLDHPQGIAADGDGDVWVANYRGPAVTELASAGTSEPGAVISPSAGWAADSGLIEAFGLAIDASGNLWVSSFGTNTIMELVGLAAPVQTPLLGPVRVP